MLDLNQLADGRARAVKEDVDLWRKAVWSPEFQKISQSMSDGEVEEIMHFCASAYQFQALARYLHERSECEGVSPFSLIVTESKKAGMQPADWVGTKVNARADA